MLPSTFIGIYWDSSYWPSSPLVTCMAAIASSHQGGTGLGLHLFERAETQIFTHPDALSALHFVPGALQHIAFTLPGEEVGQVLHRRFQELGIQTTEIMDQGPIYNFVFLDNNGIQLEAAWFKSGAAFSTFDQP